MVAGRHPCERTGCGNRRRECGDERDYERNETCESSPHAERLLRVLESGNIATWAEFEAEAPELAARARQFFDAHKHKTLATLRKDGSPRISGTECEIVDGQLQFGAMWRGVKALDLLRDPRFALHSASEDPPDWPGDAKVAGTVTETVVESEEHGGRYHLFRCDIAEVVVVGLNEERTKLAIDAWHEGRGVSRIER